MGRKNVELIEIKKEYEIMDRILNRFYPVLGAREIYLDRSIDDVEIGSFDYTEEDNAYDKLGL